MTGSTSASGRGVVRSALVRFAWWSVVALFVLGAGATLVGNRIATDAALNDARLRAAGVADNVVAPLVDTGVREGDPAALLALDRALGGRIADGTLRHVKVWSQDGTVLWADEKELVGRRYALDDEVTGLFGTRRAAAELSDLTKAENVAERGEGELLEVYTGARGADGKPFVFEAYGSTQQMRDYQRTLIGDIIPLAIGALLVFQVAVFPLALSLARRVEKGERERTRMRENSLLVEAKERRRIAQDLHDGVIQHLAGVGYALPLVRSHLRDSPDADGARDAVDQALEVLHEDIASLRSMLVEIYPPDLRGQGLPPAVHDLAEVARQRGLEVDVSLPDPYEESLDTTRLAYRVIREALRNVVEHAHARHVRVSVRREGGTVHVEVADDGVGPSGLPVEDGHFGLKLLRDTVSDFGGRLEVRRTDGGGTTLTARFPAHPDAD
jgi:signal transduction histidine kinase